MAIPFVYASSAGRLADRPATDSNKIGRFYLATDEGEGVLYRDNGTTWDYCCGRRYKSYLALLTDHGVLAPIVTVLENSLGGTPVWTRSVGGEYWCTLAGAFTVGKTAVFVGGSHIETLVPGYPQRFALAWSRKPSANYIIINTGQGDIAEPYYYQGDGVLLSTEVEIRVYS